MRIAIVGDLHLGRTVAGYDATPDVLSAWAEVVEDAAEAGASLLVQAGDVFDTSSPTPELTALAIGLLGDAASRFRYGAVVLVGNHDLRHGVDRLDALAPVTAAARLSDARLSVVGVPSAFAFEDAPGSPVVLALPYESRSRRAWRDAAGYDAAIVDALGATTGPIVVVGHLDVEGARLGSEMIARGGGHPWPTGRGWVERVRVAVDGHYHAPQTVRTGPWSIECVGSLARLDFGEATDRKRFVLVDVGT